MSWQRTEPDLHPGKFSNTHSVHYNENHELLVDAAPDWGGDINSTNPEQALAAAASNCHMMTFLVLASMAGWPVARFQYHAEAHSGKNPKGQMSVTRIDLHSGVHFDSVEINIH